MTETWVPCPDYGDRYEVSDWGRIRSMPRAGVRGGVLKGCLNSDGYPQVSLRRGGKLRVVRVHRLVCRAFHGEQPNPVHKEVAHLDGNRANAAADNLQWVGRVQNTSHKRLHGTHQAGEKHPRAKLTEAAVHAIRASHRRANDLAVEHGISPHTVSDIRRGRRWRHLLDAKHASGGGEANRPTTIEDQP